MVVVREGRAASVVGQSWGHLWATPGEGEAQCPGTAPARGRDQSGPPCCPTTRAFTAGTARQEPTSWFSASSEARTATWDPRGVPGLELDLAEHRLDADVGEAST